MKSSSLIYASIMGVMFIVIISLQRDVVTTIVLGGIILANTASSWWELIGRRK